MKELTVEMIAKTRPNELSPAIFQGSTFSVPIIRCESAEALIQSVGYLKYINDGPVYFRGQSTLYQDNIPPASIYRSNTYMNKKHIDELECFITWFDHIESTHHATVKETAPFHSVDKYALEPLMQHYGVKTRWLDLTDSLPYALFFSLAEYQDILCTKTDSCGNPILDGYDVKTGSSCISRVIKNQVVSINRTSNDSVYILALCIDGHKQAQPEAKGLLHYEDCRILDARACIPSQYLRPHMQHAIMYKPDYYDPDHEVEQLEKVVIFSITRDVAAKWLGNGELFTPELIYPPVRVLEPDSKATNPTIVKDKGLEDLERNIIRMLNRRSLGNASTKEVFEPLKNITNYVTHSLLQEDLLKSKYEKHPLKRIDWSIADENTENNSAMDFRSAKVGLV